MAMSISTSWYFCDDKVVYHASKKLHSFYYIYAWSFRQNLLEVVCRQISIHTDR